MVELFQFKRITYYSLGMFLNSMSIQKHRALPWSLLSCLGFLCGKEQEEEASRPKSSWCFVCLDTITYSGRGTFLWLSTSVLLLFPHSKSFSTALWPQSYYWKGNLHSFHSCLFPASHLILSHLQVYLHLF